MRIKATSAVGPQGFAVGFDWDDDWSCANKSPAQARKNAEYVASLLERDGYTDITITKGENK